MFETISHSLNPFKLETFKKAALQTAAFFICVSLSGLSVQARLLPETLEGVKTKATNLLVQRQKKQALQLVNDYIKTETNKNSISEATDFLSTIAQAFTNKEPQEVYETSINMTVENPKDAIKQADACLQLDPQNSDCLIQRLRLAVRSKNTSAIENNLTAIKEIIPGTKTEQWVVLATKKNDIDFKNKNILKRLNEKPTEEGFVLASLELDRSFAAKNFSRAKDLIQYFEKNYSDWPDITFYRQKIETESAEEKSEPNSDRANLYTAKCKNLSKSVARKYRYDFDLCLRGQP